MVRNRPILFGLALMLLGGVTTALACNIPVFRYALERWRPDLTELVVFHEGELTEPQQRAVERLRDASETDAGANVKLVLVDVDQASAEQQDYRQQWRTLQQQSKATLPHVLVRTQVGPGRQINGWHGPLDQPGNDKLLQSPLRQQLAQRLLAGHSVVWILVQSSDDERNAEAKAALQANLESLADKIELPEGIGLPGSELHSEVPLLVKFSVLELDPDDSEEAFLASLFRGFHSGLLESGEPLVVPVFGRGRALEVIPAKTLSPQLTEDIAAFLSGACSCQVKEQNPGFDLLLSVDWNTNLFGEGEEAPPDQPPRNRRSPVLLTVPPGK